MLTLVFLESAEKATRIPRPPEKHFGCGCGDAGLRLRAGGTAPWIQRGSPGGVLLPHGRLVAWAAGAG